VAKGDIYLPPNCGGCGEPLVTLHFNDYDTLKFNNLTGRYETNGGDAETKCPKCGHKIWEEIDSDTPHNFQSIVIEGP
jgi:hypothetical protein